MTFPTLKVTPPLPIGATELTSSNVPEVPPAAWASGTTYALNAQSTIFSGLNDTTAAVWESLQNGNLNHAPGSSPTWWRLVGYTYAEFVLGGPLGAGYSSTARVISAAAHKVYESLVNTNSADLADTLSWAEVGPTNTWAMFDQSNTTQSIAERQIVAKVTLADRVDTVALFGLEASSVTILSKVAGVTVYNQTFSLAWPDSTWPFETVLQTDLIVNALPGTANQVITVTIDNGSSTAKCGNLVLGLRRDFGLTLTDPEAGIVDYSRKEVNQWGDATLTEGSFAKKLSCRIVVENALVDRVHAMLGRLRASAVLWQASEDFTSMALFGFYRSFSVGFSYPTQSVCSLELEGLT